jgi:hypothetical protein
MASSGNGSDDLLAGIKLVLEEMRSMRMDFQEEMLALRRETRDGRREFREEMTALRREAAQDPRDTKRLFLQVVRIGRDIRGALGRIERRLNGGRNGH